MSTTAPQPPTMRLLVAAVFSAGITIGVLAVTSVGHFVYGNIPTPRLTMYVAAAFVGMSVSGWLSTKYLVQKHRRDAWWDGFAAGDEPLAEVIQLRDLKGYEGSNIKFINGSPS